MTATTPIFTWPYPQGSDRVTDGDNAIQALALAVENTLAALGSTAPGFGANVTDNAFLGGCRVWRLGKLGLLQIAVNITGSISAGGTILTLPVGYRAMTGDTFAGVMFFAATGTPVGVSTIDSGVVKCHTALAASTDLTGAITYVIA